MRSIVFMGLVLAIALTSCTTQVWYKTKSGLLYRVVETSEKDSTLKFGETLKLQVTQKVGDSVIQTTINKMPVYYMLIPGTNYYNPLEVFDYGMRNGDSIVTKQVVDSMLKKHIFNHIPKWMHPADEWITAIRVLDTFVGDSSVEADKAREAKRVIRVQEQLAKVRIRNWLNARGIPVISGQPYEWLKYRGDGAAVDTAKKISLDYEIRTLKGSLLNSTMDSAFGIIGPRTIVPGKGAMPPEIDAQLGKLHEGAVVNFYLPGVSIFGVHPPPKAKVDDDVTFKVIIRKVI